MIYADILFFAALAVFIFFKLFQAFGRQDGSEGRAHEKRDNIIKQLEAQQKRMAALSGKPATKNTPQHLATATAAHSVKDEVIDERFSDAVQSMKAIDPTLNVTTFLDGAKIAFEMVLKAYSEHDKPTLKNLLGKDVYSEFSSSIDSQAAKKEKQSVFLIKLISAQLHDASIKKNVASFAIEFVSEQIHVTKNEAGEIITGNASEINTITDIWLFERDLKSANPNWTIAAT